MDHEESPELIQARMEDTRQSLTDKVAALEQSVVGTLQSTTTSVQETVQSIKDAVQDTVQSVKTGVSDSVQTVAGEVKQKLDITHQVRENPWLMVGGAAVAGLFTGLLVFGRRPTGLPPASSGAVGSTHAPSFAAPLPAAAPRTPTWVDELMNAAGQKVKQLAEEALNTAVQSARENMQDKIPTLIGTALGNVGSGSEEPRPEPASAMNEGQTPWAERGRLARPNGIH